MNLRKGWGRVCSGIVVAAFVMEAAGCGTILYPERRGQGGGKIDVGVAVLDGVGLLLFIIPGVIAYAVDFTTGAIYLPGGKHRSSVQGREVTVVRVDPAELNALRIREIVQRETGVRGELVSGTTEVYPLKQGEDVRLHLAGVMVNGCRNR